MFVDSKQRVVLMKSWMIDMEKGAQEIRNWFKEQPYYVKLVLFCVVWHLLTGLSWLQPGHAHDCGNFYMLQTGVTIGSFLPKHKGVFIQDGLFFLNDEGVYGNMVFFQKKGSFYMQGILDWINRIWMKHYKWSYTHFDCTL